jgi:hypothetical protein
MEEIYLSWQDAVREAEVLYHRLLFKKRNGILPAKKELGDDPLYKMAADAALRYAHYAKKQKPLHDGMLDNFLHQQTMNAGDIAGPLAEISDQIQKFFGL